MVAEDRICIEKMKLKYKYAAEATEILYRKLGYVPQIYNPYNKQELTDVAPTVTTACSCPCASSTILVRCDDNNIRRLMPIEYWRLMGFTDEQFLAAANTGIQNSQLYIQAGNSIAVDVLYYIFKNLWSAMPNLFNNLRVTSLFSGIGAFEAALARVYKEKERCDWHIVNFCEINTAAIKSYCAIHNISETLNLGDVSKVETDKLADFDMLVGGSPCTDFSTVGRQAGVVWVCDDCGYTYNPIECHYTNRNKCPECGSTTILKTNSSLLIDYLRVLREKHPKVALYENVKNICSKEFRATFDLFVREVQDYGYAVDWMILNAKDYGLPQNRERLYMVLIDSEYADGNFVFPTPQPLIKTLPNLLLDSSEVDDSMFLTK